MPDARTAERPEARGQVSRGLVPWEALLAVAAWGGSFVAVRIALASFQPAGLVAARLWLGALVLFLLLRLRGGPMLPARRDRIRCVLLGGLFGGHLLIQTFGLRFTTAIRTGWIIAFIPVVIALGAHLFGGQRLRAVGWLGVLLALAGVLGVVLEEPPDLAAVRLGDGLQLLSCFTYALFTLAGVGPVSRNGALRVTAACITVAALVVTVPALVTGFRTGALTSGTVGALTYLGVGCSGLAIALWYRAQARCGSHRTGATLYFEPFVTMVAAAALLDESLSGAALVGGLVVLVGVWLVGRGVSAPRSDRSR